MQRASQFQLTADRGAAAVFRENMCAIHVAPVNKNQLPVIIGRFRAFDESISLAAWLEAIMIKVEESIDTSIMTRVDESFEKRPVGEERAQNLVIIISPRVNLSDLHQMGIENQLIPKLTVG